MYLLDTNVISELRKAKSSKINKNVAHWAKSVVPATLFVSIISILEIEIGVLLAERRNTENGAVLRTWLDTHVLPTFSDRILYLDLAVARQCARLHIPNSQPDRDAIIAATALVHGMTIVTRNIKDFTHLELEVLNPWDK